MRLPAGSFVSAAIVVPPGERSISMAADCFVPDRMAVRSFFCLACLVFARLLDDAAALVAVRFLAAICMGISFGSVQPSGCTAEAPRKR